MTVRILLADDSQVFLATARRFFQSQAGIQLVGEAHDGHEALILAELLEPDLVLLDIAMPALNGLNVARAMQFWPRAPQIVLLSMHDHSAYRAVARQLGALGFIAKANLATELPPFISSLLASSAFHPSGQEACAV